MTNYDASTMPMPDWIAIGGKIQHAAHGAIQAFKKQFGDELIRAFAFDVDRDHIGFCFDTPENYQHELNYIKGRTPGGVSECVGCFRYQAMNENIYHVVGLWDTYAVFEMSLKPVCEESRAAHDGYDHARYAPLDLVISEYNKREMTEYCKVLGVVLDTLISDNAFVSLRTTKDFFLGYQHHDDRYFTTHARLQSGKWVH